MLQGRTDNSELYYTTEQKHLGFDHGAVGSSLMAKWKIPHNISEPIAFHHSPESALRHSLEAATIHLSDIMCHTMGYSLTDDWHIPSINNTAWKSLDIPVSQLDTIIKQSEIQIEETCAILSEVV